MLTDLERQQVALALEELRKKPGDNTIVQLLAIIKRLQDVNKADRRRLFQALGLAEVVNQSDLLVTARFTRGAWNELHGVAGVEVTPKPDTQSLFPAALDFSGKKRA